MQKRGGQTIQAEEQMNEKLEAAKLYLKKTGKGLLLVKHSRERHLQMMQALQPQSPKPA